MHRTTKAYIDFNNYIRDHLSEGLFKCEINITSLCQHRCTMCFRDSNFLNKNEYLPFADLKKYFYWFRMNGLSDVFISGGEPLLYPNIDEFLEYLEELRYDVGIVTNGVLLDKHSKSLARENITEIRVSLLGLNKVHDKIVKKPDSFCRIIVNLKNAKKLLKKIQINFTALKSNYSELKQLVYYLTNEIGISKILVGLPFITPENEEKMKNEILSIEEKKELFNCIDELQEEFQEVILNSIYSKNKENKLYPFCGIANRPFCINCDGQIWPCGQYTSPLFNIKNIKNAMQFYNKMANAILWKKIAKLDMKTCNNCLYNKCCRLCIAENFQITGKPDRMSTYQCNKAKELYEILYN